MTHPDDWEKQTAHTHRAAGWIVSVWWRILITPVFGRLRKRGGWSEASLVYIVRLQKDPKKEVTQLENVTEENFAAAGSGQLVRKDPKSNTLEVLAPGPRIPESDTSIIMCLSTLQVLEK